MLVFELISNGVAILVILQSPLILLSDRSTPPPGLDWG